MDGESELGSQLIRHLEQILKGRRSQEPVALELLPQKDPWFQGLSVEPALLPRLISYFGKDRFQLVKYGGRAAITLVTPAASGLSLGAV